MKERLQGNSIVIACADPSDPMVGVLMHRYQSRLWHVAAVTNRAGVLDAANSGNTALLVLDLTLEADCQELLVSLLQRSHKHELTVVRTISREQESRERQGFRLMADGECPAPCELTDLFAQIDSALSEGRDRLRDARRVIEFQFPGEGRFVDEACEWVAKLLGMTSLGDSDQIAACTAFREAAVGTVRLGKFTDREDQTVSCKCIMLPSQAEFKIAGPPGSAPWANNGGGGLEQHRLNSLDLIRRCCTSVEQVDGGDGIRIICRSRNRTGSV